MDDMNAFERLIADVAGEAMGPARPVDVATITRSAATVASASRSSAIMRLARAARPAQHERGLSVFSAVKLVAAAAIIALAGGLVLTGILPTAPVSDPMPAAIEATATATDEAASPTIESSTELPVPAWVTGTVAGSQMIGSAGRKWMDGRTTYPEEVWQAKQLSPDPLIAGTLTTVANVHEIGEGDTVVGGAISGGALTTGTMHVENDDGSWRGAFAGYREPTEPWNHHTQVLLAGEGGYEGLRALLYYTGSIGEGYGHSGSQQIQGVIFEGVMPALPAPVE